MPASFQRQTTSLPHNVESRNVDADSRRAADELRNAEPDPDLIVRWEGLEDYCNQLDVDIVKRQDRILLTEILGDPPKLTFSLTIFKDFLILCYRGCTKVSCNDLINGFSYKVERYSQIFAILERLRKCKHNIQEEFQQASRNINDIVESADMDDDEISKVKFLTDQLLLQSQCCK